MGKAIGKVIDSFSTVTPLFVGKKITKTVIREIKIAEDHDAVLTRTYIDWGHAATRNEQGFHFACSCGLNLQHNAYIKTSTIIETHETLKSTVVAS